MNRKNLFSGTEWEEAVGYSRGVRIGNVIEISGTISMTNSGEIVGEGDPFLQTRFVLMRIQNAIEQLGGKLSDVIRTRVYVTDISQWDRIGKAHLEFFGDIKPCNTIIEVSKMINDSCLVEIEATAILLEND